MISRSRFLSTQRVCLAAMRRSLLHVLTTILCVGMYATTCATTVTVDVSNFMFAPNSIIVNVGDTIRWQWTEGFHTTTSDTIPSGAAAWDVPINSGSTTFDYQVTVPGYYHYYCTVHGQMMDGFFEAAIVPCVIADLPAINYTLSGTCNDYLITLSFDSGYASYLWNTGETTNVITSTSGGFFTVTVTDVNGCTGFSGDEILPFPPFAVPITGNPNLCSGTTTELCVDGTYASYLWNTGETTQCITVGEASDYSVTVTNDFGCTGGNIITVLQQESPVVTILTDSVNCDLSYVALIAAVSASTLTFPLNYNWSNGSTDNAIVSEGGFFSVTVTDANLCSSSDSIYLLPPPAFFFTYDTTICDGSSITLDAQFGDMFMWSTGETTQTINASAAGTYSVTAYSGGCEIGGGVVNLSIFDMPTIIPTVINSTGNNSDGSISLNISGAGAPYVFIWSNGATTSDITGLAPDTYTVSITDSNGCNSEVSFTIASQGGCTFEGPFITVTNVNPCIEPSLLDAGAGNLSYLWSNGDTTQTINVPPADTYTVTVVNANGCSGIDSVFLLGPPPILVEISGNPVLCSGATTELCVAVSFASYLWNTGETTQCITVGEASDYTVIIMTADGCMGVGLITVQQVEGVTLSLMQTSPTCNGTCNASLEAMIETGVLPYSYLWNNGSSEASVNGLCAGDYALTVFADNGCSADASITIISETNPIVNISVTYSPCGLPATLDASAGFASYAWSTGETTQTITTYQIGVYDVTVTNANGCSASNTADVTDGGPPPIALTILQSNPLCAGSSVTLSVAAAPADLQYNWSTGDTMPTITITSAGIYDVTVTSSAGCLLYGSDTVIEVTGPGVSIVTDSANCSGSYIELTAVADGFLPLGFMWSTGDNTSTIISAGFGSYFVTVTDANGCSATNTINLLPPAVAFHNIGDTSICAGNSVILTSPFNFGGGFLWSNGAITESIIVSTAGTYDVSAYTPDGCAIGFGAATVSLFDLPVLSTTVTNATGTNNGAIDLSVSAIGAPYTYLWSNGATTQDLSGLNAGTYTVTVTTVNGCTITASATVSQSTGCSMTAVVTGTNPLCYHAKSGFATVAVSSGVGPYSYQWSNGKTTMSIYNNGAGTYSVTVTDANGCTATDVITLSEPPSIVAYSNCSHVCPGQCDGVATINVVGGGTPPYSFQWSTGLTTQSITELCAGVYWVTITDSHGCKKIVGATVAAMSSSNCNIIQRVSENDNGFDVSLYPNPTERDVNVLVTGMEEVATVKIVNTLGEVLAFKSFDAASSSVRFDASSLTAGIYFIEVQSINHIKTVRFIKQ